MNKIFLISLFALGCISTMFATGDDPVWFELATFSQHEDNFNETDHQYFLTNDEVDGLLRQLPDLDGHAPLETVLNAPMDTSPDSCDEEEYVTESQMLRLFNMMDEDPTLSKLFVYEGNIDPNDINQEDIEPTNDQLYQDFSRLLYKRNCIPHKTKIPSESECDFIANVFQRFDNDALKNFSKDQQTVYRKFLRLLSDGWWHEMLKKFRVSCDLFSQKDVKLLVLLYKIINYTNRKTKKLDILTNTNVMLEKPSFDEFDLILAINGYEQPHKDLKGGQSTLLDEENEYRQLAMFEEAAAHETGKTLLSCDASSEYGMLAKKLMNFVPDRKGKGRSREDIEKFLRYLLYKFDKGIEWNELSERVFVYSRFYNWRSRGHFKTLQTQILKATEHERSKEDTKILDLLDKINGYSIRKTNKKYN